MDSGRRNGSQGVDDRAARDRAVPEPAGGLDVPVEVPVARAGRIAPRAWVLVVGLRGRRDRGGGRRGDGLAVAVGVAGAVARCARRAQPQPARVLPERVVGNGRSGGARRRDRRVRRLGGAAGSRARRVALRAARHRALAPAGLLAHGVQLGQPHDRGVARCGRVPRRVLRRQLDPVRPRRPRRVRRVRGGRPGGVHGLRVAPRRTVAARRGPRRPGHRRSQRAARALRRAGGFRRHGGGLARRRARALPRAVRAGARVRPRPAHCLAVGPRRREGAFAPSRLPRRRGRARSSSPPSRS